MGLISFEEYMGVGIYGLEKVICWSSILIVGAVVSLIRIGYSVSPFADR